MTPKPNQLLPNGARVVCFDETHRVVWAINHKGEHVTWFVDQSGQCYWGHYFTDPHAAANNFKARAGLGG